MHGRPALKPAGARPILVAGALLAGSGILLAALGEHGLGRVLEGARLGWWRTAVQYQMIHGLALLALAAAPIRRAGLPALLLGGGVAIFSASLYLMALTNARWLGAVTPAGGLAMIGGWVLLAWRAGREAPRS